MTVTWGAVTTHPNPVSLQEKDDFVGGTGIMADGSFVIDTVATKKRISLQWSGITSAESAALYALGITRTSATMDMTNVGGSNYSSVISIPGTASRSPSGGDANALGFDFSVEVRTA